MPGSEHVKHRPLSEPSVCYGSEYQAGDTDNSYRLGGTSCFHLQNVPSTLQMDVSHPSEMYVITFRMASDSRIR